jgi:hypothetical protein
MSKNYDEEPDEEPRHSNIDIPTWDDPDQCDEAAWLLECLYELSKSDPRGQATLRLLARYKELTGKVPGFMPHRKSTGSP